MHSHDVYSSKLSHISFAETLSVVSIDEFKLYDGHRFATIIISMESGHVLYLASGRKKLVVYESFHIKRI